MKQLFETLLDQQFARARQDRLRTIDVNAGRLHRSVGRYPDPHKHRMPVCCEVMRSRMKSGDQVLYAPPKGNGSTFTVRYWVDPQ